MREAQRANRETVHYLTNGRQHAFDMINGHAVSVMGRARSGIELAYHNWSLEELVEAFEALGKSPRRRPPPHVDL